MVSELGLYGGHCSLSKGKGWGWRKCHMTEKSPTHHLKGFRSLYSFNYLILIAGFLSPKLCCTTDLFINQQGTYQFTWLYTQEVCSEEFVKARHFHSYLTDVIFSLKAMQTNPESFRLIPCMINSHTQPFTAPHQGSWHRPHATHGTWQSLWTSRTGSRSCRLARTRTGGTHQSGRGETGLRNRKTKKLTK